MSGEDSKNDVPCAISLGESGRSEVWKQILVGWLESGANHSAGGFGKLHLRCMKPNHLIQLLIELSSSCLELLWEEYVTDNFIFLPFEGGVDLVFNLHLCRASKLRSAQRS